MTILFYIFIFLYRHILIHLGNFKKYFFVLKTIRSILFYPILFDQIKAHLHYGENHAKLVGLKKTQNIFSCSLKPTSLVRFSP
jgi:hypothetical protein